MDRRKVYIYKFPDERDFIGLACDCHMHQRSGEAWRELWFLDPPEHGHMIEGEVLRETAEGFIFRSDGFKSGEWCFRELTIDIFKQSFYRHVVNGDALAKTISSTEELHALFRKEFRFGNE